MNHGGERHLTEPPGVSLPLTRLELLYRTLDGPWKGEAGQRAQLERARECAADPEALRTAFAASVAAARDYPGSAFERERLAPLGQKLAKGGQKKRLAAPPRTRKAPASQGLSSSGGGIRSRDLRVMRRFFPDLVRPGPLDQAVCGQLRSAQVTSDGQKSGKGDANKMRSSRDNNPIGHLW
jgi:hypothetical protein